MFWIGFLGSNSTWFWKLIERFVLNDIKEEFLKEDSEASVDRTEETRNISFDSGFASDGNASDYSDDGSNVECSWEV